MSEDEIFHLTWGEQQFIQRPSSKVLGIAIIALTLSVISAVVLSFLIEIDRSVSVQGEIVSSLGIREVRTLGSGIVSGLNKSVGDLVEENEVVARLSIGQMTEQELREARARFVETNTSIRNKGLRIGTVALPDVSFQKSLDPELIESHLAVQRSAASFNNERKQNVNIRKLEVAPLRIREKNLLRKISLLKKSKHRDLMGMQIEAAQEELTSLRLKISNQLNQSVTRLDEQTNSLTSAIDDLCNRIELVLQKHEIRSPVKGRLAKVFVQNLTQMHRDQPVAMILPENTRMQVELNVRSKDIGKLAVGQKAIYKLEAYPYQQYGYFSGVLLQVEQIKDRDQTTEGSYLVRSDIELPKNGRLPANDVNLIGGMRLEGSVITSRKKIVEIILEKLFD